MMTLITILGIITLVAMVLILIPGILTLGVGIGLALLDVVVAILIIIGLWKLLKMIFTKKDKKKP